MTRQAAERKHGKPPAPGERCERCRLPLSRHGWECSLADCPNRGGLTASPPEGLPFDGGLVPRRRPHD